MKKFETAKVNVARIEEDEQIKRIFDTYDQFIKGLIVFTMIQLTLFIAMI